MGQLAYIQWIESDWRPGRPDHELPGHPPSVGGGPVYPDRPTKPVDPDYGGGEGEGPAQPLPPGQLPSLPAPPGDLSGKVVVLVWKPGEGWSGKVFDKPSKPPGRPDQGLPRPPGSGGRPDHELPHPQPPRPDQGLPPGAPGHPDQGLPPTAQPKPGYPDEQARWNR